MRVVDLRARSRMIAWRVLETGRDPYVLEARLIDAYLGLFGQIRLTLVDRSGRIHHFDYSAVKPT